LATEIQYTGYLQKAEKIMTRFQKFMLVVQLVFPVVRQKVEPTVKMLSGT